MPPAKPKTADPMKIILQSNLREDGVIARTLKLATGGKANRQAVLRKLPDSEDAMIAAAIEIQRVFRGFCTRCRLLTVVDPCMSATALYGNSKHQMARIHDFSPSPEKLQTQPRQVPPGLRQLQLKYRKYVDEMTAKRVPKRKIWSFEVFCVAMIQRWWRRLHPPRPESAPRPSVRPPVREVPLSTMEAARMIQRAWRKHIDVQVYRYYRDLINFKQKGDPAMMLRCINPNEAKMLDAAMGIHIKFRLAGEKFPPNIYYKIYTHRPVQDMCANSPKVYTMPDVKRRMARDVHNKGDRVPQKNDAGWYERFENNGWRLVSDRLLQHIMADPVTYTTSAQPVHFHHNKLQRRQDVEKRKKYRLIEWMKTMYKHGMLHAKSDDPETVDLIEGAAAGMVHTVNRQGCDAVQDWEVDELLDWTTSLNFDDYITGWKEIATSNMSEKAVFDRLQLYTEPSDPFEFHMRQQGSTKPSFNTPQSTPTMYRNQVPPV